ncbi:hypothetical protein V6N13_035795 [Hibiscus sabdariffa]|uniref:Uncharacterized protein n=1 Tax=Hibiscus sabdariffa TaxID=183260 RepID=A0ABR2S8G4_9ROSI
MRPPSPIGEKEMVLKRGSWTEEEDKVLASYIKKHGVGSWNSLPEKAGLQRCGKSCRLRWMNYLSPDIKRGKFSLQEEQTIIQLHALLGNRWSAMVAHLPKRTDNEIKNHWNTHLKKRLMKMGIDPMTHKPRSDASTSPCGRGKKGWNLSHMAQWESARLEAEARLVRESRSKQIVPSLTNQHPLTQHTRPTSNQLTRSGRPECLDILKAWRGIVAGMFVFPTQDLSSPVSTLCFPFNGLADTECSAGWREITTTEEAEELLDTESASDVDVDAWLDFEDSGVVGNYDGVLGNSNCWDGVLNLPNFS